MMAEIYGRADGLCKGLGGSMHLTDVKRGFLGTSGIVGAGIPHAAGAAWAAQIRNKREIVFCFFGDGASKQGAFHETLNIASLWKLPVIFVMENNGYNVVTTTAQEDANAAAGEPLAVTAFRPTATSSRRRVCRCTIRSTKRLPSSAIARSMTRRYVAIRCRAFAPRWSRVAC